jgi:hypothetical protein
MGDILAYTIASDPESEDVIEVKVNSQEPLKYEDHIDLINLRER